MDRAEQITQLINENPGIRYSELVRQTGFANGVISHHLSKIEQTGKITIKRTPRVARIYPCWMPLEETILIKHLKSPTSRSILFAMLDGDMSFKEITRKVKKSQGTISLSLKNMCEDNIIERKLVHGNLIFQLVKRDLLDSIMEKRPSFIENTANNISDIFSSL